MARREPAVVSLAEIDDPNLHSTSSGKKASRKGVWLVLAVLSLVGLVGVGVWQEKISATPSQKRASQSDEASVPTDLAADLEQSAIAKATASQPEQLLNHRRYDIADVRKLVPLSSNSEILLQPDAQASVEAMLADAKAKGVQLDVISGFRTVADQNYLYFDLKAERGESARTRAEVSAPPGYSEHHTGYAVDFIDKSQPATFLEESFENTPAYKWLVANAPFYNFELSFGKDSSAAVAYEPWHWRYVGNRESLELFYK